MSWGAVSAIDWHGSQTAAGSVDQFAAGNAVSTGTVTPGKRSVAFTHGLGPLPTFRAYWLCDLVVREAAA
jgi:hypothetical protein